MKQIKTGSVAAAVGVALVSVVLTASAAEMGMKGGMKEKMSDDTMMMKDKEMEGHSMDGKMMDGKMKKKSMGGKMMDGKMEEKPMKKEMMGKKMESKAMSGEMMKKKEM